MDEWVGQEQERLFKCTHPSALPQQGPSAQPSPGADNAQLRQVLGPVRDGSRPHAHTRRSPLSTTTPPCRILHTSEEGEKPWGAHDKAAAGRPTCSSTGDIPSGPSSVALGGAPRARAMAVAMRELSEVLVERSSEVMRGASGCDSMASTSATHELSRWLPAHASNHNAWLGVQQGSVPLHCRWVW